MVSRRSNSRGCHPASSQLSLLPFCTGSSTEVSSVAPSNRRTVEPSNRIETTQLVTGIKINNPPRQPSYGATKPWNHCR